jgi:hypothetical protein
MNWVLAAILICGASVFTACSSNEDSPVSSEITKQYCPTVQHLVTALDANPEVKQMVVKSIAEAKKINPDKITNPAQTLDEYYDFLDWSLTRMPWDYFPEYTRILGIDEWATELTCNVNLTKYLSLQPVLHIIKTDNETNCIGVLRLNVSL